MSSRRVVCEVFEHVQNRIAMAAKDRDDLMNI